MYHKILALSLGILSLFACSLLIFSNMPLAILMLTISLLNLYIAVAE